MLEKILPQEADLRVGVGVEWGRVEATVGMKGGPGNLQETQDVLAHLGCCNEHRTRGLTQRFIPHGSGGFGSW